MAESAAGDVAKCAEMTCSIAFSTSCLSISLSKISLGVVQPSFPNNGIVVSHSLQMVVTIPPNSGCRYLVRRNRGNRSESDGRHLQRRHLSCPMRAAVLMKVGYGPDSMHWRRPLG